MTFLLNVFAGKASQKTATILLLVAALFYGTMPFFTKSLTDVGIPPYAVEFYRYAITAAVLFPALITHRQLWVPICWGLSAGFCVGLGWIGYARALEVAPVSSVAVLYMTFPVFALLIGWLFYGDRPGKRACAAAAIILAAAVLAQPPSVVSGDQLPALLMSLSAPLSFGYSVNIVTRKLVVLPPVTRIATLAFGATIGLSPLVVASHFHSLVPSAPGGWWFVAGIALITALIPQLLYLTNAPVVGPARTSMISSAELPTNFIIGWLAFAEAIGPVQWIACILILGAILLTPAKRTPAANIPIAATGSASQT